MNKRIHAFCSSNDLDEQWMLLCQIENMQSRANKAAQNATRIGTILLLPFLTLVLLKTIWATGFFGGQEFSRISAFMTSRGINSWTVVLSSFFIAFIAVLFIIGLVYKIGVRPQNVCQSIIGSSAYKAKQLAQKAKKIKQSGFEVFEHISTQILLFGTIILPSVVHNADCNPDDSLWIILLKSIPMMIGMVIPAAILAFLISIILNLPINISQSEDNLKIMYATADDRWVQLDPYEAGRRENLRKEIAETRAYNAAHQPAASSYYSGSPDKGTDTHMTDMRNGQTIYYKGGQYVNENGDPVPYQYIDD